MYISVQKIFKISRNIHYILNKTHLTSKLTYLKAINPDDYPKIVNWINDSKFNELLYQGWKKISTDDFSNQVKDEQIEEEAQIFSQFSKKTNELVGWCGLYFPKSRQHRNAKKAEIRSFVGTEFWGSGFGTEQYIILVKLGFDHFNLNRIYFGTHEKNIGTQKIYQKLGFLREGIMRQDYFRNEYADIYQYAVLKNEYNERVKEKFKAYLKYI